MSSARSSGAYKPSESRRMRAECTPRGELGREEGDVSRGGLRVGELPRDGTCPPVLTATTGRPPWPTKVQPSLGPAAAETTVLMGSEKATWRPREVPPSSVPRRAPGAARPAVRKMPPNSAPQRAPITVRSAIREAETEGSSPPSWPTSKAPLERRAPESPRDGRPSALGTVPARVGEISIV